MEGKFRVSDGSGVRARVPTGMSALSHLHPGVLYLTSWPWPERKPVIYPVVEYHPDFKDEGTEPAAVFTPEEAGFKKDSQGWYMPVTLADWAAEDIVRWIAVADPPDDSEYGECRLCGLEPKNTLDKAEEVEWHHPMCGWRRAVEWARRRT